MRLIRLLPCLLLVAACGDNGNAPNPGHTIDAPGHDIDAPVDIDAPAVQDHSRVWAVGDLVTDGSFVAYSFDNGATLPFDPANPPARTIPGGGHVLQPNNLNQVIDGSADGSKLAFIADATTAGTFDLYVSDGDGGNTAMLAPGTGVAIQSVTISPDGSKVAFTSDVASPANGFDLYVVNTVGTPAPVKVSPDRTTLTNTLNVTTMVWSADSKLLGFYGDLHVDKATEAFVIDMSAATPVAVTLLDSTTIVNTTTSTAALGASGSLQFNAAGVAFFTARLGVAGMNATTPFFLVSANSDGTNLQTTNPAFVPKRGDNTDAAIGAIAISADGKKIVFNADTPTAATYNMFVFDFVAAGAATNLTNLTAGANSAHTSFFSPMWFSPDGKSVASVANWLSGSARNEPFVTKLDGTANTRLANTSATCTGACDAVTLQWSADGKTIFVMGDVAVNNDNEVFKADATMTDQTLTPAIKVTTTTGDFIQMIVR